MTDNIVEKDRTPTPQELNTALIEFTKHLPKVIPIEEIENMESEAFGDLMDHREQSEYSIRLIANLTSLLDRSNITEQFRRFIVKGFRDSAIIGGPDLGDDNYTNEFFFFLDHNKPQSGGIFDPERAKELEKISISRELKYIASEEKILAKRLGEERAKALYQPRREAVGEWRTQFKENYGEDLLIDH